jgi:hypothetical protein
MKTPKSRLINAALFCLFLASPFLTMGQKTIMQWDFENITNRNCIEPATGVADTIEGNFEVAPGVVGKGLRLDGFTTRVVREGKNLVKPGAEFTIEAWVALGEYPLNWCPVITTESDEAKGYRLLIGPYGQASFEVAIGEKWIVCSSAQGTLPLRQWAHLTGVYTAGKQIALYVNGKSLASVPIQGSLTFPLKPKCTIGMVTAPGRPSDTIRTWGTVPAYYGLDGTLDEILVFDKAMTADEVKAHFSKYTPAAPDIPLRPLPKLERNPGRFGGFYTKLKYYPGWDNLWPVGPDPDIVVCFENNPVKFVFWRGIRYGPCWVTENENWMADQSLETWGIGADDLEGCFEHMQDRHCRFSHVRIIENNDARVVVHWRYAPVSAHNNTWMPDPKTGWECWVDEYYYVYPDASAIRKVFWNQGTTGTSLQLQESIPLTQPGQRNDELLENDYVHVADYDYNTRAVSVDLREQPADWSTNFTVQRFNFRSENKPYICFEPGNYMWIRWIGDGYTHFPVNQARCDGRWTKVLDRPTSISSSPCSEVVVHEDGDRLYWIGLYGMNRMNMNELVSFGRSWVYAPELSVAGNEFKSAGYDRSQRCYQIEKSAPNAARCDMRLLGSKESPVINPAFYVKNWNANRARVLVNGKELPGSRVGVNRELGGDDLTVFLFLKATSAVNISIDRVD